MEIDANMTKIALHIFLLLTACLIAQTALQAAPKNPVVDLALVLAVDVSLSMDHDEQKLQRDGYVAAFRDPAVLQAVRSGIHGRISVSYLEWAGQDIHSVIMPWRIVGSPAEAEAFAAGLEAHPISRAQRTSISSALLKAADLFPTSGTTPIRRVIDVSGDGPNNAGPPVLAARRAVLDQGIVINGLAIQLKRNTGSYRYFDLRDLDRYYANCVIGGPGSFMVAVADKAKFAQAIRQKLILEISGNQTRPKVERAQFVPEQPNYDCLIGEKRWRNYMEELWQD